MSPIEMPPLLLTAWYSFAHLRVSIEATTSQYHWGYLGEHKNLTLEELLACIFLEEGFVNDRTVKVADH